MAEDISNAESPVQYEMTANPNVLIEASEGQADTVNVLDDDTSALLGRSLLNRPTLLLQNR